jgi:hypothetical protein
MKKKETRKGNKKRKQEKETRKENKKRRESTGAGEKKVA